jgi:ATP-binding cassette subfamily F protein uup
MAQVPLLTLNDITLGFGGRPLFAGVSLAISQGERLCVVGRNGSGKSTLMKIAAGLVEPDAGERLVRPGAKIAYLPQDPDPTGFATLGDYAAADLGESERWRAESALDGLKVDGACSTATASGGERRRAALARLIAGEPDLMLLDEPTNHLDIQAIEWLEQYLAGVKAGFAIISHDRAILTKLTRATLWIDRGEVRRGPHGFGRFEEWRDKIFEEETAQRHKLDRLIKDEARWAVEGISARRTRNQGRVRRLAALRAERSEQIARTGMAAMALSSGEKSGKLVIEAKDIAKSFGSNLIFKDFSIRIARGERIALVGPNGVGKTTLLQVLTGEMTPDSGTVRIGSNIQMAVFDQNRLALDPKASLWESLTGDKVLGVKGNSDQVMVRGKPRHVIAYLKDFLFDERQARGPASALSGGERARLLLARIMARESNLLVLDEPTNDLDIETLDLLQELIADFDGTVLLVSHDRDFIDRVATATIAMEGDGEALIYAGGWSDYRAQRGGGPAKAEPRRAVVKTPPMATQKRPGRGDARLTFAQQKRLDELPTEIDQLGAEIAKLEAFLSGPEVFAREPVKFRKATERQRRLALAEEEWLELEGLREASA